MYEYNATLVKVVDGDTLDVLIDLGFYAFALQRLRLKGINTPETFGVKKSSSEYQRGFLAKQFVIEYFEKSDGKMLIKTLHRKGKYGRFIADCHASGNMYWLCKSLLNAGHAIVVNY